MAVTKRRRRTHRALATTRAQLVAAAVVTALLGLLLVPAAAQAIEDGALREASGLSTGAAQPLGDVFPAAAVSATEGTSAAAVRPGSAALRVAPVLPGGSYLATLPAAPLADVHLSHAFAVAEVARDNVGLYEQAQVRRQADGDQYGLTAVVRHSGHVVLRLDRRSGGQHSVLARTQRVATAASGRPLHTELRVVGSDPVTLMARAWEEGAAVPDWQVTATDDSDQRITAAGSAAVGGYLSRDATERSLTVFGVTVAPVLGGGGASPAPSAEPSSAEPTAQPSSAEPTAQPSSAAPTAQPSSAAPTTPATTVPSTGATSSPEGFVHPGIMTSADQLTFVRGRIAAGAEPWTSAYRKAKASSWGDLGWRPRPTAVVGCGAYNRVNEGCTDETRDAQAAYTQALLYAYSGDQRHADKAIEILDAWSGTLQTHRFDTTTYTNGRLQAAWAGSVFPKAAEIIRYSDAGWRPDRVERFERMLRTAFLPLVRDGWTGGGANWQLSMAEATTSIGVFLDDRSVFEDGVGDWRTQVVSTIYLSSDGPKPVLPAGTVIGAGRLDSYWHDPVRYVDGLQGETCRDADHMVMGFAAAVDVAETARIQGLDLYGEQRQRLVAAMEYNTRFLNDPSAAGWVCPEPLRLIGTASRHGWEVAYHHYAEREGISLPQTRRYIEANRPKNGTELFMNWSTLTHAGG